MQTPRIDGYVVDRLVGFGSTGRVWRTREEATGDWVALKWLRPEANAVLDRLQREALAASGIGSAHLVRVREVVQVEADIFVVSDFVSGDSLETLLARRDQLSDPELVTLLAPTAAALGDLHAAGLVHGAVTPSNLLIAPDGRPILSDCGVALALEGTSAEPADDVRALAELGIAVKDCDRSTLASLLVEAAEASSDRRPTARELATAILESGPAGPIRITSSRRPAGSAPLIPDRPMSARRTTTEPREPIRRLPVGRPEPAEPEDHYRFFVRRRLVVGAAVAVAVLVSVLGLIRGHLGGLLGADRRARIDDASGAINSRATSTMFPTPQATKAPTDWSSTVQAFETARARAFVRADPSLLAAVYLPTSSGLERDRRTVVALENRGLHAVGFAATVVAVHPIAVTTDTAELDVTDRLSAYSLVDRDDALVGRGKPRPARTYLMTLARTATGWRVKTVSRADQNIEASAGSSSG